MVEQPADDLEGIVLESQGRPVKQLEQPVIGVQLHQRRDRRVFETGIGGGGDLDQRRLVDLGGGEWRDDAGRDLVIGKRRKPGERPGVETRPGFGQIEAAVGREPAQQHILETQRRSLAPRAHIAHSPSLPFDDGHIRRKPLQDKRLSADAPRLSSARTNILILRPR